MPGLGFLPASKPSVDACSSCPLWPGRLSDVLSEDGKELGDGTEWQRRGQPRRDAPEPALVVQVAGQWPPGWKRLSGPTPGQWPWRLQGQQKGAR